MICLTVTRREFWPDVTRGQLELPDGTIVYTLERPWQNNEPNVSCIPDGLYDCERVDSPRFGDTFEIPVPGRTHILLHKANYVTELKGCIAMGMKRGASGYVPCVVESKRAFDKFIEFLKGEDEFQLAITSYRHETITV